LTDNVCLQEMRCACCDSPKLDSKKTHCNENCNASTKHSADVDQGSTITSQQPTCEDAGGDTDKTKHNSSSVISQTQIVVTNTETNSNSINCNQNAQNNKKESNSPRKTLKEKTNISPTKGGKSPTHNLGSVHLNSGVCEKTKTQTQNIQLSTFQTKETVHVHRTHSPDKI